MGGRGSGGRRAGAGRLRVPVRRVCAHCRRGFVTFRRGTRWCDAHRSPALRRGDPLGAVLRSALARFDELARQFERDAPIAAIVSRARAELEQLAFNEVTTSCNLPSRVTGEADAVQTSALGRFE
jgi:hypothetical protein